MIRAYIKGHWGSIVLYAGVAFIFAIVMELYNIDTEAVEYAFLLGLIWFLLYEGICFLRFYTRHQKLLEAEHRIKAGWEPFPKPQDVLEADYQRMLENTYREKAELTSQTTIVRQDMLDYYSMWAHQIKTPIAAMRVLLQSGAEGQELKMELFKVEQYVEMVLSYLRMEQMSSDLVFNWYELDDLIRQAIRKYAQLFIPQKMKLRFTPTDKHVLTDEKWLVFVLEQIISNALKYTKAGEISIYYDENREQLAVTDTGIGIQAEDLPRVFEKGFTGYNGRADKKSTGIGLYLCKNIMNTLKHGLAIESVVGEGTCVYLTLERELLKKE